METLVEDMFAGRAIEGNTRSFVVTDVTAGGKTVVDRQVTLEVRRSCVVAAPGLVVVGRRSVMGRHYLVHSVFYLCLHVQLGLLFRDPLYRDPLSLDRDRFHLCCRASLDLPQRGRYDLLRAFLPDSSIRGGLTVWPKGYRARLHHCPHISFPCYRRNSLTRPVLIH